MIKPKILKTKVKVIQLLLQNGECTWKEKHEQSTYRSRKIVWNNIEYKVFLQYYVRRPQLVDYARISVENIILSKSEIEKLLKQLSQ